MGDTLLSSIEKSQYLHKMERKAYKYHIQQIERSSIPGTEAGEYAAQFYADMVIEGERKGGVKGFFMQAGGWTGGLFASLWTPETALTTTFTLATAGLGAAASAGRLGAASIPVMRTLQVTGSFQGGLSAGQAITGTDLSGEKLSTGARLLHGAAGAITILSLTGLPNSALFGRARFRPGQGPGILNKGSVRLGWSWRGQNLPAGGKDYFALHGGGYFQGLNQGPHWHLYLNRFWPSGPAPAPGWATAIVRTGQAFGVIGSGIYGYELGNEYFSLE